MAGAEQPGPLFWLDEKRAAVAGPDALFILTQAADRGY
jgi:hypothetical protein